MLHRRVKKHVAGKARLLGERGQVVVLAAPLPVERTREEDARAVERVFRHPVAKARKRRAIRVEKRDKVAVHRDQPLPDAIHAAEREAVLIGEVNLARIEEVRRGWPFLRDRRIDAYAGLSSRFLDSDV